MKAGRSPTIKMKLLGTVVAEPDKPEFYGALYTDGVRWAAYEPTPDMTRIIDTRTGGSVNRPDPVGCNGQLVAVGGGELLYACANPECPGEAERCPVKSTEQFTEQYETTRYVVEDIVGAGQHPLVGENRLPTGSVANEGGPGLLVAIGRQWAQGEVGTHFGIATFFANWHTGVIESEERTLADAAFYENLNSRDLLQSLCEPLTRPVSKGLGPPPFAPIQYKFPFAVIGPLGYEQVPLELRRCGKNKSVPLPESGPYASSVQLDSRVLSWVGSGSKKTTRKGSAYVTRLLPHSQSWHGKFYELTGWSSAKVHSYTPLIIQHTATMIFATVKAESSYSQIYYARLPWDATQRNNISK